MNNEWLLFCTSTILRSYFSNKWFSDTKNMTQMVQPAVPCSCIPFKINFEGQFYWFLNTWWTQQYIKINHESKSRYFLSISNCNLLGNFDLIIYSCQIFIIIQWNRNIMMILISLRIQVKKFTLEKLIHKLGIISHKVTISDVWVFETRYKKALPLIKDYLGMIY